MEIAAYRERLRARADSIATACVHAGAAGDLPYDALEPPVVMSSAFRFASSEQAARAFRDEIEHSIYTRWHNPTVAALESGIARLEGAEAACATGSGVAAVFAAITSRCEAGDHVVAPRSMYGESVRMLRERLPRFGIETTFVDGTEAAAYRAALRPRTRVVYLETPANPTLAIADIAACAALARSHGAIAVVDGTFATPFCQTPLAHGADLVVHSMTKALSGHGDVIAGTLAGRRDLVEPARELVVKGFGAVLAPWNAMLVMRGLRTLAVRQERACASAFELARRLHDHPAVARVFHPSLAEHPGHALAEKQMFAFGSMLSFELRERGGDARTAGAAFVDAMKVATHAVSLGDVRTLISHPASTTHVNVPEAQRREAGIGPGLLRCSVGLEGLEDLWRDIDRALAAAAHV